MRDFARRWASVALVIAAVVCARETLKDILDTPASDDFDPVRAALDLKAQFGQFASQFGRGVTLGKHDFGVGVNVAANID